MSSIFVGAKEANLGFEDANLDSIRERRIPISSTRTMRERGSLRR